MGKGHYSSGRFCLACEKNELSTSNRCGYCWACKLRYQCPVCGEVVPDGRPRGRWCADCLRALNVAWKIRDADLRPPPTWLLPSLLETYGARADAGLPLFTEVPGGEDGFQGLQDEADTD